MLILVDWLPLEKIHLVLMVLLVALGLWEVTQLGIRNIKKLSEVVFVGVGISTVTGSFAAGKNAAEEALSKCAREPTCGLVFVSPNFESMENVAQGVQSVLTDIPWIGCTTCGEITNNGVTENSVICTLVGSDYISMGVGVGENIRKTPTESGEIAILKAMNDAINKLKGRSLPHKTLIVFPSGIIAKDDVPCVEWNILKGINKHITPDWNVVGASAADNAKLDRSWQFINGKVYEDSVVCGVMYSKVKINIGVGIGYNTTDKKVVVTKSMGNIIYEFDKENACKRFANLINKDVSELIENPIPMPIIVNNSIGFLDDNKSCWCTPPIYVTNDWMKVTREISIGRELAIVKSNKEDLIRGCDDAVKKAIGSINRKNIAALLLFPCALYKLGLEKEECNKKIQEISNAIGENVPIVGFYTYGEQGRSEFGTLGQLNQAVIVMIITKEF